MTVRIEITRAGAAARAGRMLVGAALWWLTGCAAAPPAGDLAPAAARAAAPGAAPAAWARPLAAPAPVRCAGGEGAPCTGEPPSQDEARQGERAASTITASGVQGEAAPEPPARPTKETSVKLPSGLHNPMPGGIMAGYMGDTGLDIAGNRLPVYAIAAGTLDYSEAGHTLWTGKRDTPYCIRIELDEPIPWEGRQITHVYYAHLSELAYQQAEGAAERIRIEAGERLGISGVANGSPHLHLGLLLDGEVEQTWGTYLLEDDIRQVLGGLRRGARVR
ncbi:MAG: hypothetical protein IT372_09770 [Polyangiaceae bacterium]|nr:hypothetical protein [Polyangiaceae bacterium]